MWIAGILHDLEQLLHQNHAEYIVIAKSYSTAIFSLFLRYFMNIRTYEKRAEKNQVIESMILNVSKSKIQFLH